jgi:rubrerythrin
MDDLNFNLLINKPLEDIIIDDVFKTVLAMEKKGEKLYYLLADFISDIKAKELLLILSEEESRHFKKFQEMSYLFKNIENNRVGTNLAAITRFTQGKLFDEAILREKLKKISDLDSIYEFAMSIELDSMLLYQEIKDNVGSISKTVMTIS